MSFEVSKMSFKSNFSDIIADGKDIHGFATMTKLKKSIFEAKMKPNKKFVKSQCFVLILQTILKSS